MRKKTALLLALVLLSGILPTVSARAVTPVPEDSFELKCTSAILIERSTGEIIYEKDAHRHLSPASVTKVMTLLLAAEAVENGIVRADESVIASKRASSMGGSQIWLREGETMSFAEMVKCVAVVSANDCAVAIAEHLAGSEEAFTAKMNLRAAELGLEDTHFTNCTGLFESDEHYTCAADIAVMARELLGHEFVRQFTCLWTDTVRDGAFGLTNTNRLVRYYPGCTGLKTGFTSKAMFCLAASAERDGLEMIAVILHGDTSELRFAAARTLLDYGFANYALYTPQSIAELPAVPVKMGKTDLVQTACACAEGFLVERAELSVLRETVTVEESVRAPVEAGTPLGELVISAGEKTVARYPLTAAESVEVLTVGELWLELVGMLCGQKDSICET